MHLYTPVLLQHNVWHRVCNSRAFGTALTQPMVCTVHCCAVLCAAMRSTEHVRQQHILYSNTRVRMCNALCSSCARDVCTAGGPTNNIFSTDLLRRTLHGTKLAPVAYWPISFVYILSTMCATGFYDNGVPGSETPDRMYSALLDDR